MDAKLDATLVVSEHVNYRMRVRKTPFETEIMNSFRSLPTEKQLVIEKQLNAIYGDMKQNERDECLNKWDAMENLVTVRFYKDIGHGNYNPEYLAYFHSIEQASKALQKWCIPMMRVFVNKESDYTCYGIDTQLELQRIYLSIADCRDLESVTIRGDSVHWNGEEQFSCHGESILKYLGRDASFLYELTPEEIVKTFGPRIPTSLLAPILHKFKKIKIGRSLTIECCSFSNELEWRK